MHTQIDPYARINSANTRKLDSIAYTAMTKGLGTRIGDNPKGALALLARHVFLSTSIWTTSIILPLMQASGQMRPVPVSPTPVGGSVGFALKNFSV
jgi:hypothetical protein